MSEADAPEPLDLEEGQTLRAVRRGPMLVIALLLAVALGTGAYLFWKFNPGGLADSMTIALSKPPEVEPVELEAIPEETARKLNAETPFTTKAVPAAAPFQFAGSPVDFARALDCAASAIYYEAGAEPLAGQQAVVQVILNRVRHPAFPKSVCGVIFQGQERRTGCQFSYTCDGSMARRPSTPNWESYRAVARSMLTGTVYAPVGWATHYHTDWVRPKWSSKLDKVASVRTHLFFRWPGFWGTAGAFRKGNVGSEPAQARLVNLSPVHRTPETLAQAEELAKIMATLIQEGVPGAAVAGESVFTDDAGGQFILAIPAGTDPSQLPMLAERTCGARDYCKLMAWPQGGAVPKGFPIDDASHGNMAFSYLRNKTTGFDKSLWNCALYPRDDRRQCIRKRVVIEGRATELIPMNVDPAPEKPRSGALSANEPALDKNGLRPMNPEDGNEGDKAAPLPSRTEGRRIPGRGN